MSKGNGQFAMVPMSLFADERFRSLGSSVQIVFILLLAHKNKQSGLAWPTMQTIATQLGLSKRWVLAAVKDLRSSGLITTERRHVGEDTRLVYSFPTIYQSEEECASLCQSSEVGCASPKRTIDPKSSALSCKSSEPQFTGQMNHSALKTNEEQTNRTNEQQHGSAEDVAVVVDSHSALILKEAGLSKSDAEKYGERWDAEYLKRLVVHCKETAKTNPQGMLIRALQSDDEWQLPSLPDEQPQASEEATRQGIWNQICRVWACADPSQIATLEAVYGDAAGLTRNCPLPFMELLGDSQDVLKRIIAASSNNEKAQRLIA